ncbi:MAG: IniB N-terminal domain-containing protein [Mycobacterium sp.]|nr:IniB N-terminal domain-containing protein [Mycobacterium sp.]
MIALIDWILNLFRSEDAARAFVAAPEQSMRDAGLAGVTAGQLSSVVATAVPGMVLGGGDPILGLQRAVANQYGFAPAYAPAYAPEYAPAFTPSYDPVWNSSPTFAPAPTFAPQTDLASHNDVPLLSPSQDAGANAQNGAFNLGFGDITLGSKTTQTATGHGVVVGSDANGDILSGDGAVLGNDNAVTNGDIRADHGANISTGQAAVIRDSGTTTTAGVDAITTADSGSVIKGADNSLHNGSAIGGSETITTVGGSGNTTNADGHETTLTSTTTEVTHTTTTTTDNSDSSVHETAVTDASSTDSSHHSLFDTSLLSNNDTALHSNMGLRSDMGLHSDPSGNHLLGLGF